MATSKKVTKTAPVETTEKVAAPAVTKERKIGMRKFKDDQIITLLVNYNPKRKGSASAQRFEAYEDEMTVAGALKAGITSGDLSWDVEHGFIKIADEFDDSVEKKTKPESKPKAEKKEGAKKVKAKAAPAEEEEEEEE